MHYKNGRPAKNGDKVALVDNNNKVRSVGILYEAQAGNDYCNGRIAAVSANDLMPNLKEVLHVDDLEAKPYSAPEQVDTAAAPVAADTNPPGAL
jgi:hypothetical protein